MKKVGLALGCGGAKGLAHILILETLDEMGIKPTYVTGTSIGAVIGMLYCSGRRPTDLREQLSQMSFSKQDSIIDIFSNKQLLKWLDYFQPQLPSKGLLKCEHFLYSLFKETQVTHFEELEIPLSVVATNYANWQQEVFYQGELQPAIQASMSLPGIFEPVRLDGKLLIDGGAVNPVPFDILPDDCDLTIAIDVLGSQSNNHEKIPALSDAVFNTFQIMQKSIVREKQNQSSVDIYIELDIPGIRVLEFYKANEIFKLAEKAKDQLKHALDKKLSQ